MSKMNFLKKVCVVFVLVLVPFSINAEELCFDVENMSCGSCVKKITETLVKNKNIKDVEVSLEESTVKVKYQKEKPVKGESVVEALKKIKYPAKEIVCPK